MPSAIASRTPTGVGIFTRPLRRSSYGTPAELARRARDHRLSFVPLLGVWQDDDADRLPNERTLEPYADALRIAGIDVWLWGYPHAGREQAFVDAMVSRARRIGARGVILDPEVSYKGRPRAMERLVARTLDALDESLSVGFTTFGQPQLHTTFPWEEAAGLGWGSPQLYTPSPSRAVQALTEWQQLGWTSLLPALPTFGARSTPRKLQALVDGVVAHPAVRGLLFWSWNTSDGRDLRLIARAADHFSALRASDAGASSRSPA